MYKTTRADRRKSIYTYSHWVYGLFLEKQLVYVGVTADPAQRVVDHALRKKFDEFRLIKGFSSREKAEEFEKYSILALKPILNIACLNTTYEPKKIALKDFQRFFKNGLEEEYDFEILTNDGIRRRKNWQAKKKND